ncbi:MAG TPA: GNAT family N-acetyltransferase [Acetobacteraceae bacterium]|jgi:hypothetical protein|nr:GNAT family N-acetyltransferase [Acetobacteraceae bacterium]
MQQPFQEYHSVDALPARCDCMFASPADGDFFATRAWYETVVESALPPGNRPLFLFDPRGVLLPLQVFAGGKQLSSLTTPYTCAFSPPALSGVGEPAVLAAGAALARALRRRSITRFDALTDGDPVVDALIRGLRRGGLVPLWFRNFGNWHEAVAGMDWPTYLAGREGKLRETVRRKLRKWEGAADRRFRIVRDATEVEDGIAAYEHVYRRSWKEPEPFPSFNPAIMRVAARQGRLRLGLLFEGDRPVAAQFWIVGGGRATVLKLAHDEMDKADSPGTVLTAMMLRRILSDEQVEEIDFGRGDDPYKQLWASRRRQRMGVVLANPWSRAGAVYLARHAAGAARRAVRPLVRR